MRQLLFAILFSLTGLAHAFTPTPTFTFSPTITPTNTPTLTRSPTMTRTQTFTFSPTRTPTFTPTITQTSTVTPTTTPTMTPGLLTATGGSLRYRANQTLQDVQAGVLVDQFGRIVNPAPPSGYAAVTLTGATAWASTPVTCTVQPCTCYMYNQSPASEVLAYWLDRSPAAAPIFGGISVTAGTNSGKLDVAPGDWIHWRYSASTGNGYLVNRY